MTDHLFDPDPYTRPNPTPTRLLPEKYRRIGKAGVAQARAVLAERKPR